MFGENPTRKQELDPDGLLLVQDIFPTIQGEGPFAGRPCVFVRLWGCNLKCTFCDTDFESNREQHTPHGLANKVESLLPPNSRLVVVTGGEPLRQNILPFFDALIMKGIQVQVETAGTLWVKGLEQRLVDDQVTIVVSPKSGKVNAMMARAAAWKYIINDRNFDPADGLPMMSTQQENRPARLARPTNKAPVYLQPMDEYSGIVVAGIRCRDEKQNQRNIEAVRKLAMQFGYRVSLQQHKILGVP